MHGGEDGHFHGLELAQIANEADRLDPKGVPWRDGQVLIPAIEGHQQCRIPGGFHPAVHGASGHRGRCHKEKGTKASHPFTQGIECADACIQHADGRAVGYGHHDEVGKIAHWRCQAVHSRQSWQHDQHADN